jgi:AcrR family transcriptional regulator
VAAKPTRTIKTPAEIQNCLVLREAGYSLAAIATKTGISPATLTRHFSKHGAVKGTLSLSAVNKARQQLLSDTGFVGELKQAIASSILDDLSHVAQLRQSMCLILEDVMTDTSLPAHYKSRAIAALATSLTMTQKAARVALQADNQPIEQDSIPELFISELTAEDIEQMRIEQRQLSGEVIDDAPTDDIDYDDNDIIEEME